MSSICCAGCKHYKFCGGRSLSTHTFCYEPADKGMGYYLIIPAVSINQAKEDKEKQHGENDRV